MSISIPNVMPVIGISIIKNNAGMILRDAPMSQADGGLEVGRYRNGSVFYLYAEVIISNVPYVLVQSQKTNQVGWFRVQEADGTNQNIQNYYLKERF
jgi:hypothetical protein